MCLGAAPAVFPFVERLVHVVDRVAEILGDRVEEAARNAAVVLVGLLLERRVDRGHHL